MQSIPQQRREKPLSLTPLLAEFPEGPDTTLRAEGRTLGWGGKKENASQDTFSLSFRSQEEAENGQICFKFLKYSGYLLRLLSTLHFKKVTKYLCSWPYWMEWIHVHGPSLLPLTLHLSPLPPPLLSTTPSTWGCDRARPFPASQPVLALSSAWTPFLWIIYVLPSLSSGFCSNATFPEAARLLQPFALSPSHPARSLCSQRLPGTHDCALSEFP